MDPARRLSGSLMRMRAHAPFFAALALFAETRIIEGFGTAGTDGRRLLFDPAFIGTLEPTELDAVLLHELLHAALLHPTRRGTRHRLRWNVAADISVNGIIASQSWVRLPEGALRDERLEALSVEEIYDLLPDSLDGEEFWLCGDLSPEDVPPEERSPEVGDASAHWRLAHAHARAIADGSVGPLRGALPAGFARETEVVEQPSVDWRQQLWQHLVRTPNDFGSFDRRFVHGGLYLESLEGERLRLFVAIDTSGSVDGALLGRFLGELRAILRSYPHIDGALFYADTQLYGPYPLDDPPTPRGGGGTCFEPFFEAADAAHDGELVAVYLTDGHGSFPSYLPTYPVYWVVVPGGLAGGQFPFGTVIRMTAWEDPP